MDSQMSRKAAVPNPEVIAKPATTPSRSISITG